MGDSMTEVDDFEKRNGSQSCGNGANLVVYAKNEPASVAKQWKGFSQCRKLEARDETSRSVARRAVDIYASRQSSVQESGPASRSVSMFYGLLQLQVKYLTGLCISTGEKPSYCKSDVGPRVLFGQSGGLEQQVSCLRFER